MVAVGNLAGILWADPYGEETELKEQLSQQFGSACLETLLGQDQPFEYHTFNDVFLKVTELTFADKGTLLSVMQEADATCNIIIS